MNEQYQNPTRSVPVILASLQNISLLILVFFMIQTSRLSFYEGGIGSAIFTMIALVVVASIGPVNLIAAAYFLIRKRRNYSKAVTIYIVVSALLSLLITVNASRLSGS